ncbi:MAG: phosphoribosyltransferase [Actinomycetota bacterium]|nr:phosphoribosyltransferase [Actinomycetota bacterium]
MPSLDELLGPLRCIGCRRPGARLCSRCVAGHPRRSRDEAISGVDRVLAPWAYEGPGRSLILALKLRSELCAASPLVEAIVTAARSEGVLSSVVTWVPGRRPDIRRRGFDHAEVLARGVAGELGLPAERLVKRSRASGGRDQVGLGRAERLANLAFAFRARPCGSSVMLVDDLITTGATAAACAAALRLQGAVWVEAACACRV